MALPEKAKAIVFKAPYQMDIEDIELREIGEEEVLVETLYTLISTGTISC